MLNDGSGLAATTGPALGASVVGPEFRHQHFSIMCAV